MASKRKLTGLVGAFLLAVIGTVLLVGYVQSARDEAVAGELLVDVLVVRSGIAEGTPASEIGERVSTEQVPAKVRAEGAVTDLESLDGLVAGTDLVAGEQLVASRFLSPEVAARGDVPAGKLQVTVSLEPERALGGQLTAGDTVAVLASFDPFESVTTGGDKTPNTTHLILHKVVVTAVQFDLASAGIVDDNAENVNDDKDRAVGAPTGKLLVTLALDAPSVERVVFAAEHGTVWLSAEPVDAPEDGTTIVERGNVY